jgi:hypothetical protein
MNDNAASISVTDSSGQGNHGTTRRNTSDMAAIGVMGGALNFNGISDYITVPKERYLITEKNSFSIAGWFNLTKVNSIQNLITWKEPSSAVQFVITDGANNTGVWAASRWLMRVPRSFTPGTWYHIAWTRSADAWKIYINGIKIAEDIDNSSLGIPILDYHIGAEATAPSQFLSGLLDDVRIYKRALSEAEIKAISVGQAPVPGTTDRWDYRGRFANIDDLDKYGNGTYQVKVYYKDGTQDQTTTRFTIPGTTDSIPQPTKKPVLTSPKHNSITTSPVVFKWEACNDANAISVGLRLEKQDTGEYVDITPLVGSVNTDPIPFSEGMWQARIFCERWYDTNNPDNINISLGKYSESDYNFEIRGGILVARWKMDDKAADTLVADSSGNLRHGTARRNTADMAVNGIINGALSFNGINDYITIPKEYYLITERNDFTISAWFNLTKVNSIQNLITWKEPSSGVQFVITDGANNIGIWASSKWVMRLPRPFTAGTWYHIAWTRSGDTWNVYVNGVKEGTDVIDNSSLGIPILNYLIGAEATAPSQFFSGLLDGVRIYSMALKEAEIKTIYNDRSGI